MRIKWSRDPWLYAFRYRLTALQAPGRGCDHNNSIVKHTALFPPQSLTPTSSLLRSYSEFERIPTLVRTEIQITRDKRLGTNGQQIANNPWGIDWSCDRWHHVTLKGQGHDPKIFGGYYLETSGDTASVTTEARLRKLYVSAKNVDEGKKQSATFKVRNGCWRRPGDVIKNGRESPTQKPVVTYELTVYYFNFDKSHKCKKGHTQNPHFTYTIILMKISIMKKYIEIVSVLNLNYRTASA